MTTPPQHIETRNVIHVVVAPSSRLVSDVVRTLIENCDRERWYPSLFIENLEGSYQQLAFVARSIGVPVTSARRLRGEPRRDWLRTFLDEWFYVRDANPAVMHIHAENSILSSAPATWIERLMFRTPAIQSVYTVGDSRAVSARITGRQFARPLTVPAGELADPGFVARLYEERVSARARR